MYVPEVQVETESFSPLYNIDGVHVRRWRLLCKVCRKAVGAPVQCARAACGYALHATCARKGGFEMGFYESEAAKQIMGGKFSVHCNKHADTEEDDVSRLPYAERRARERAAFRVETAGRLAALEAERAKLADKILRASVRAGGGGGAAAVLGAAAAAGGAGTGSATAMVNSSFGARARAAGGARASTLIDDSTADSMRTAAEVEVARKEQQLYGALSKLSELAAVEVRPQCASGFCDDNMFTPPPPPPSPPPLLSPKLLG